MQVTDLFEQAPYDPTDPNPWLALYLDMSLPLSDEAEGKAAVQFRLPVATVYAAADPPHGEAHDDGIPGFENLRPESIHFIESLAPADLFGGCARSCGRMPIT